MHKIMQGLMLLWLGGQALAGEEPALQWQRDVQAQEQGASRQTDFNTYNYQPRPAVNRMQPPARLPVAAKPAPPRWVKQQAKVYWQQHDRSRQVFTAHWRSQAGWIDYASVCANYRAGSLSYRDCRKAAKRYFVERCKAGKGAGYCHAENNFFL